MPSVNHSRFRRVSQISVQQQNRLCKLDLVVDSIGMVRSLFAGCPSLVSCNSSHAICFENFVHTAIHLNFHSMLTIYFDFPDKIAAIYRQTQFQFCYWLAHTGPICHVIFQSNKPVRFWVFAVIFRCCSSVSLQIYIWLCHLKKKKMVYLLTCDQVIV